MSSILRGGIRIPPQKGKKEEGAWKRAMRAFTGASREEQYLRNIQRKERSR